ncbi:MAG: DUF2997 domain-containing protein [Pirellulaceae bacterium]
MAQVTLIIDAEGNTTVEVNGMQGPQCQDLTANVERLLGAVQSVSHKPEYHDACGESAQAGMGQIG